jgi:hypothetical protein
MNTKGSHKWLKCGALALLMLSGSAAYAQRGGGGGHGGFGGGGFHGGGFAGGGSHAAVRGGYRGGAYRGGYGYGRGGYGWRGGYGGYYGGFYGGYYGALGLGLFFGALPFAYSTYWWDGVPYYYADNNYYQWDASADAYETVAPPSQVAAAATQGAPTADPGTTADLFAYPSSNQSAQQQAKDRQECTQWATKQTSTQAAPAQPSTSAAARTHSDYLRAEAACLTGRGYSVR